MNTAAGDLEFEEAARLRDEIRRLEAVELGLDAPGMSPSAATSAGLTAFGPRKSKSRKGGSRRR